MQDLKSDISNRQNGPVRQHEFSHLHYQRQAREQERREIGCIICFLDDCWMAPHGVTFASAIGAVVNV